MIRSVELDDASQLADIYNFYVADTVVTFEEQPISTENMAQRIENIGSANLPWLVAEDHNQVIGYAYASKWKERSAYRYTVEITVYLCPSVAKQGWGTQLYQSLLAQLKASSVHSVIGVIALPNEASVALHEKLGMQKVAHFSEVGRKFDEWVDVGYWQLTFQN